MLYIRPFDTSKDLVSTYKFLSNVHYLAKTRHIQTQNILYTIFLFIRACQKRKLIALIIMIY